MFTATKDLLRTPLPLFDTLLAPLLIDKRLLILALLSLDDVALEVLLPPVGVVLLLSLLDPPVKVLLRDFRVFLSFSALRVCLSIFIDVGTTDAR